ncbi:MAG TPA: DUF5684 domain-containing protein [Kofleriaceae bacterium]|nr:DUF5684 domain-containing protein [Kofleriaceae bacterium]
MSTAFNDSPVEMGHFPVGFFLVMMAVMALMVVSGWKVFEKAGKPGWAVFVPIYNSIVMLEIARKPVWWIALMFVPVVSFVVAIMVVAAVANNFGKGTGFALGMIFLPMIFLPILAFGDARYLPPPAAMPGFPTARAQYY